jgi:hypothetical protein
MASETISGNQNDGWNRLTLPGLCLSVLVVRRLWGNSVPEVAGRANTSPECVGDLLAGCPPLLPFCGSY